MSKRHTPPAGRYTGQKYKTEVEQSVAYIKWFNFLKSIYTNRFTYTGLEELPLIKKRWLEQYFFDRGNAVFFRLDPELTGSEVILPYNQTNNRSLNGDPVLGFAYTFEGRQIHVNFQNSVVMWDNTNRDCNFYVIDFYAKKLATVEITADVNLQAQKTPIMILCPESQRLTMENLYKKYSGDIPVIYGDKELLANSFTVLKTGAPYLLDDLIKYKTKVLNECLTFMGVNNVDVEKAERLVTNEITSSNAPVIMARYTYLDARKEACEEINRMFDLNIDVKYRDPVEAMTDMYNAEGGEGDGSIYNAAPDDLR